MPQAGLGVACGATLKRRPKLREDRLGGDAGPTRRERGPGCACGCKGSHGRCRRSRTRRSKPERVTDLGIVEVQCKKCARWWPLECFPLVGAGCQTRHGIRPECNECRLGMLAKKGWYNR